MHVSLFHDAVDSPGHMHVTDTAKVSLGGLAAVAVAYGMARYGYGLFVPEFRAAFELSTAALGMIASGAYLSYLAALVATGVLGARLGPRVPVVVGSLAAAVGMVMIAVATGPLGLAVGAVVAGSAAGFTWAPFSDAVERTVPVARRGRALAIVSTGTSVGLLLAAPIALAFGAAWRAVWLAFAACAAATAAYNARVLPHGPAGGTHATIPRLRLRWLARPGAAALLTIPFAVSAATSIYLTYAVDVVRAAGWPAAAGPILWSALGLFGLVGLAAGDLARRLGLRPVTIGALAALSLGIALLGTAPASLLVLVTSAMTFSAGFMVLYGVLVISNRHIFDDRPSAGWSAAMLAIAAGSIVGPATAGLFAGRIGLTATLIWTAALPALTAPLTRTLPAPRHSSQFEHDPVTRDGGQRERCS